MQRCKAIILKNKTEKKESSDSLTLLIKKHQACITVQNPCLSVL